jgi:dTDP-4-amino-4,6-dideoxygalactose transaminase
MRNFGFAGIDNVVDAGTNGKMTEISAAMGLVNLEIIQDVVAANRRNYEAYKEGLSKITGVSLVSFDVAEHNNFQYVVVEVNLECPVSRDYLVQALQAENVLARKYFWPGCHRMKPYVDLFPDAATSLANTELVAGRVIVLPTGTTLSIDDIAVICSIIRVAVEAR